MTPEMRYCPSCATLTAERFCPADGVATFARKKVLPTAAYLAVGDVVGGKYRVQNLLGTGGFGAVYEAEHTGGLGLIALKVLSPGDHEEGDIRRFYREAQVTAALRHPNTVRVFDVGQHDSGALYLAMELVHGHSLEEELRARKQTQEAMTEVETLEIAIGVLKSLSEAHGRGLVHRDLKPANLMLTEVDGERLVKVLDFGIALVKGSSITGSGQALGTPTYMSPEQCTGEELDGRSDLYSLGIVLYRCLCGEVPFADSNPLTVMMNQATLAPAPLISRVRQVVTPGLIAVIEKALEKEPSRRFTDAKAMRAALEEVQRTTLEAFGADVHLVRGGWTFRFTPVRPEVVVHDGKGRPPSSQDDTAAAIAAVTPSDATRVAIKRDPGAAESSHSTRVGRESSYSSEIRRASDAASAITDIAAAQSSSRQGWWVAALAFVGVTATWVSARPSAEPAPAAQVARAAARENAAAPAPPPASVAAVPPAAATTPEILALPAGEQARSPNAAGGTAAIAPAQPVETEVLSGKEASSGQAAAPAVSAAGKAKSGVRAGKARKGKSRHHGKAGQDDDLSLPE